MKPKPFEFDEIPLTLIPPRPHAELCPVCRGSGKGTPGWTLTNSPNPPCHGCHGLGWVTVR